MNGSLPKQEPVRHDFSKIRSYMALPNLIDVQRKSYERFLQMNLLPEEREDTGLQEPAAIDRHQCPPPERVSAGAEGVAAFSSPPRTEAPRASARASAEARQNRRSASR